MLGIYGSDFEQNGVVILQQALFKVCRQVSSMIAKSYELKYRQSVFELDVSWCRPTHAGI
jgi:hypothetical protein